MKLCDEVTINAPAQAVWAVLGEQFGAIGEWAAPIIASSLAGEPGVGAVRTCHIARFGPVAPGTIQERLIAFDREGRSFAYEAIDGMPRFVERAINRWSVHRQDESRCVVRTCATLKLRGPMVLLSLPLSYSMRASGRRVLDELRYRVEEGRPHPRKLTSTGREPDS